MIPDLGFGESWIEQAADLRTQLGFAERLPQHIVRESVRTDLSSSLANYSGPILVLRGTQPGAMLASERAVATWNRVPSAVVHDVDSGHEVFEHPAGQAACARLALQIDAGDST